MVELVGIYVVSYMLVMLNFLDVIFGEDWEVIFVVFKDMGWCIVVLQLDMVIVILDDYVYNFFFNNFLVFCIGVVDSYQILVEYWLKVDK